MRSVSYDGGKIIFPAKLINSAKKPDLHCCLFTDNYKYFWTGGKNGRNRRRKS